MTQDDIKLVERLRPMMKRRKGYSEKKMFGGICFMINGNMAVGVSGDELMVRVGKQAHDDAIRLPGARLFDMTGRPMKGWLMVAAEGMRTDDDLAAWINRGVSFAESLPPK